MKTLLIKLKSRKGETLVESMFGMLIVALASTVLVTGVIKSLEINKTTTEMIADQQYTYVAVSSKNCELSSPELGVSLDIKYQEDAKGFKWFEKK